MKGSVPGLAAAGIAHIATTEARTSFLTIATDAEIHTLTNQGHNGFVKTTNKGHNEVGLALGAAGHAVLGVAAQQPPLESPPGADAEPAGDSRTPAPAQAGASPTIGERLRELADLHKEGILSDEEFISAKATLLGGL